METCPMSFWQVWDSKWNYWLRGFTSRLSLWLINSTEKFQCCRVPGTSLGELGCFTNTHIHSSSLNPVFHSDLVCLMLLWDHTWLAVPEKNNKEVGAQVGQYVTPQENYHKAQSVLITEHSWLNLSYQEWPDLMHTRRIFDNYVFGRIVHNQSY